MRKFPLPTVITGLVLALILVIYAVTFVVRFNEVAVRVSIWNRANARVVDQPGLYLRWPEPIETVRKYDTRLRVLDTPETEIKTHDKQNVIVGCYALWRIKDPLRFYVRVPVEKEAEAKIRERINEKRAAVFGRHDMSEFVNLDRELVDKTYAQIEQEMLEEAAPGLLNDYGVELVHVGIRRVSLPEEATKTVLDAMKQERERMAARIRQEGISVGEAIKARAQSARKQILAFADRKAAEIEAAGVQASERILEQIGEEDTEFFIWLRRLEALRAALKQRTTIFFDASSELFKAFMQPPSFNTGRAATTQPAAAAHVEAP